MNKKTLLLLVLILLLAFFLRFYKVTQIPPSLNWDEVSIGYNAYSILKTGQDEWGQFLPTHFKAYGEYKLPVQIYASIPGIAIFGLNELGVRITPVVYGTLTILVVFFLGRALFQNNWVGLGAAFLLAISPWHIQLTRASFESSFATFWISLGLWFLVKGFIERKWLILSMVPFAISIYTYNSARVFTPLFLLTILFIYRKTFAKTKRIILLSAVVFAVMMLPLIPFFFSGERSARYKLVSITDDPGLVPRINERRGNSKLPQPLPRLVHNKATYISFYVTEHYLTHFTPDFLFVSGAPHKQHHVQGMGELYWFQAPFLLIGLYFLLSSDKNSKLRDLLGEESSFKQKHQFRGFLTSWLLIAFVPVAVTNDSIPHALRTLIAAPFYQIVSAFGGLVVYQTLNKKHRMWRVIVLAVTVIVFVWQFVLYLQNYYTVYPKLYSRDWQYGNRQVVDFVNGQVDNYDLIVFTRHYGEPHMFTLFYLKYDPAKYQTNPNLVRFETHDWVRVLKFDKFYFPDLGDDGTRFKDIVAQNPGKKMLFIGKDGDFPEYWPVLKTIRFLNNDIAFKIVEVE